MPRRTTGRLEKRGKTWLAIWAHNGKRYAKSTGTSNRQQAEALLEEYVGDFSTASIREVQRRIAARVSDIPATPLASAWSIFEKAPKRKPVTALTTRQAKQRIDMFVDWVKKNHPSITTFREIDNDIAAEYWAELQNNRAPYTANAHKLTLQRLWAFVLDKNPDPLVSNPWLPAKIAYLPKAYRSRRELTVEELARVLSLVEGELRTLFAVGIYTGLRLGDAARLSWGSIDLVRGFIFVVPHKTAKHGTPVHIPIAPALRDILLETPASKRNGPVMPAVFERYEKRPQTLIDRIQRIFKKAGIQTTSEGFRKATVEVGFHSLRHTFVSLSANAGVPLAIVQAIVGHTNAGMTEHYFHVADSALERAAAALPNIIDPKALPAPSAKVEAIRKLLADLTPEEKAQVRAML